MSYFSQNTLLLEKKNLSLHSLPVETKNNPPNTKMLMINHHILNGLELSIPLGVFIGSLGFLLSGTFLLPFILSQILFLSPLSTQAAARDFLLINKQGNYHNDMHNTKILAINDGIVETISNVVKSKNIESVKDATQFENFIVISHEDRSYFSLYSHLLYNSMKVSVGDKVSRGQYIANVGNTTIFTEHLHFELAYTHPTKLIGGIGVLKTLSGFENHYNIPLSWKEYLIQSSGLEEVLKLHFNDKFILNRSGMLDNFAYIQEKK